MKRIINIVLTACLLLQGCAWRLPPNVETAIDINDSLAVNNANKKIGVVLDLYSRKVTYDRRSSSREQYDMNLNPTGDRIVTKTWKVSCIVKRDASYLVNNNSLDEFISYNNVELLYQASNFTRPEALYGVIYEAESNKSKRGADLIKTPWSMGLEPPRKKETKSLKLLNIEDNEGTITFRPEWKRGYKWGWILPHKTVEHNDSSQIDQFKGEVIFEDFSSNSNYDYYIKFRVKNAEKKKFPILNFISLFVIPHYRYHKYDAYLDVYDSNGNFIKSYTNSGIYKKQFWWLPLTVTLPILFPYERTYLSNKIMMHWDSVSSNLINAMLQGLNQHGGILGESKKEKSQQRK